MNSAGLLPAPFRGYDSLGTGAQLRCVFPGCRIVAQSVLKHDDRGRSMVQEKKAAEEEGKSTVNFDYIKSPQHRVVHADGVWGGVTPRGLISMSFWNTRGPIPRRIVQEVGPGGELGKEVSRESRDAIVREVDVGVILDLEVARSLAKWLEDKIELAERVEVLSADKETTE